MIEILKQGLIGQYEAALSMFNTCVMQCPDDNWESRVGNFPFWHVAYHTLYFADLYLAPNDQAFEPPDFYRENYQYFGRLPQAPHEVVVADMPYDRQVILDYVQHCLRKVSTSLAAETAESLQGSSGFWWYTVPRAEFHMINIRHIQHHASHLALSLRRDVDIDIGWRGSGFEPQQP